MLVSLCALLVSEKQLMPIPISPWMDYFGVSVVTLTVHTVLGQSMPRFSRQFTWLIVRIQA